MQIISTVSGLRAALAPAKRAGRKVGLVPTMGYLHEGHMTLVARARAENDIVVTSIFVNPLQFGANEDLAKYPRDLARDSAMLEQGGVDFIFAPSVEDMYPHKIETVVDVPSLGRQLEGEVRPGHFAGVCTVVTKLFNIVGAERAYFGEKDYQQLQIIRQMAEDLNQPVEVVGVPTVRDHDGLALSSRNVYLTPDERRAAAIVPKALDEAQRLIDAGLRDPTQLEAQITDFIAAEPLAQPEVVALRDPQTLEKLETIETGALLLLFVRFGTTKLLDNRILTVHMRQTA
ncbi:pantoate--beta-alanine ligase [Rhizobium sp. LjRoot254]|uniref:pantoate--beta-alanine ligase n=1 Tax=Rhizobium sp. LjRoot254 TaxID=3342297 RepID=UPI003ECEE9D1